MPCVSLLVPLALAGATAARFDLAEVAARDGRFETLLAAVEQAGLAGDLSAATPMTLLAPTDQAFARMPEGVLDFLLQPENAETLRSVLLHHVVPGRHTATELLTGASWQTLAGSAVEVRLEAGRLRIGAAGALDTDLAAGPGLIQVIDSVLVPPGLTLDFPVPVDLIDFAIFRGVELFNTGQTEACAAVYEVLLQCLASLGGEQIDEFSRQRILTALEEGRQVAEPAARAWVFRYAMDEVRAHLIGHSPAAGESLRPAAEKTVFSFDDPGIDAVWFTVNDDVMGGISRAAYETTREGFAVFSGALSLANNGGFATIRSPAADLGLAGYQGLALRVRGDGRTYELSAMPTDRRSEVRTWRKEFETTAGEWQELRIPFPELELSVMGRRIDAPALELEDVRSLAVSISDKNEQPFRLEIDWIRAYRGEAESPNAH